MDAQVPILRNAHRRWAITGAALALALAGCSAGTSGSDLADNGPTGSAGTGGGELVVVSALVPTGQLSAVGFPASGSAVAAAAVQSAPQSAPWYAQGDSPGVYVYHSQDFQTAIAVWGQGSSQPTASVLTPDGRETTLYELSGSEDGVFVAPDRQWLIFVPGASAADPETQVYRLSRSSAEPVAFSVPAKVSAGAGSAATVLGFTASDQVLVLSGGLLWEVAPDGATARQFAAGTAADDNFASGVVDEVAGTPQSGLIAMDAQTFDSNGILANSTVLLSPAGNMLHTFAGGTPVSFDSNGQYLVINTTPVTSGGASASEEACSVVTYTCRAVPGGIMGGWLPNGDMVATVDGNQRGWWNPATGAGDTIPAVFGQFSLNLILPTSLMNRLAVVKNPGSYFP